MAKVRIQEVRKMLLPVETVVDAVLELERSHGSPLGNSKVAEARVETGADPRLTLVLVPGTGSAEVEKHYTLPAIAAAAIHYCFRARIPLPRHGTKSIEVVPEGFQLTIQTLTEVLRLHGEAGRISQIERRPDTPAKPIAATGDAALDDPTAPETAPAPAPTTAAEAAAETAAPAAA